MKKNNFRLILIIIAFVIVFQSGCAYYNTFFLAKKHYKRAEELRTESESETIPTESVTSYETVIEKSSKVIVYYPKSKWVDDALFYMGMSLLWTDEPSKAATKFEELLGAFPDSKYANDARYWRSVAWMKAGEFDKAEADFMAMMEEGDHAEEAAFMLAQGFFEKKDYVSAELYFEEFIEKYPKSAKVSLAAYRLMVIAWQFEKYDRIAELDELIEKGNLPAENWFNSQMMVGEALIKLDKLDDALVHFRDMKKAKGFSDRIGDIEVRIGLIYYNQNDTLAASETWHGITNYYKKTEASSWAFYYLGQMYLDFANLELALEMFEYAVEEKKDSEPAELAQEKIIALKEILDLRKKLETPEDSLDIDHIAIRLELAEMYVLMLDQPDSAINQYKAILKEAPDSKYAPKASYSLGWTYAYSKDDWKSADSTFAGLLKEYSESDYALGAVQYFEDRGAALDSTDVRSVGYYFVKAEEYLFTYNNPNRALQFYNIVIDSFPESRLVPKAISAKAYIYSEHLDNPEESRRLYEILSKNYVETEYDSVAQIRLGEKVYVADFASEMPPDSSVINRVIEDAEKAAEERKNEKLDNRMRDSLLVGKYPDMRERLVEPLEFDYPQTEWRNELARQEIHFKIFVDAFCKITKAEILKSCGNDVIDETVRKELIDESEFDPDRLEVTERNMWYMFKVRVEKPKSLKYENN